jgi:hypothetical protein
MNIKASRLRAEAGKIAPTALVTSISNDGKDTTIINPTTDSIHMRP